MEYNYPKFTPEMKKTHTILIPNMYGPSFEYQVNDWNVESLDELTEMIPMECPDIPGFCS